MKLTGIHRYSFRCGESAEILGIQWIKPVLGSKRDTPEGVEVKPCYRVRYADGVEDLVAVSDFKNFTITENGK